MHMYFTKKMAPFLLLALLATLVVGTTRPSYAHDRAAQIGSCTNLVVNGDMQADSGWTLDGGPIPAAYVSGGHEGTSGTRGLQIGPKGDSANKDQRWSSALQKITLPATGPLMLSFWYRYEPDTQAKNDSLQVGLLDADGQVLTFFFKETDYRNVWRRFNADITQYAGRDVKLFFAVESDGVTGKTHLLIDDVELCASASVAAQPTAPGAATATVAPAAPTVAPVEPTVAPAAPTVAPVEPTVAPTSGSDLIPFSQLGVAEQTLRKPFDSAQIMVGLPADWQLTEGTVVQLDLTTFMNGITSKVDAAKQSGAALDVSFNGTALTPVSLDQIGTRRVPLSIPAAALLSQASDGRHILTLTLRSGPTCNVDQQPGVIVRATSALLLAHKTVGLSTALSALPRPIFQNSFLPDAATIIVPDKPTASELQAALAVAAGFGRMTNGGLSVGLTPLAKLTPELRQANNLIFVGKPTAFGLLKDAQLPAPVDGSSFKAADASPSDGIVQMAVSPWNAAKVLLVVGGGDDAAVIKASKALSTGSVRGGAQANLAVVAEAQASAPASDVVADRSFSALGYGATTVSGRGDHLTTFRFDVPAAQSLGSGAYLDLVLNHSTLLDYDRSSAIVTLNNQPISSLHLSNQSASLNTIRLNIPGSAVRTGSNDLAIHTQFVPQVACGVSDKTDLSMTIWPESILHLPQSSSSQVATHYDLSSYPQPFGSDATLSSTAFILASDDPPAWDAAAQVAFGLGTHTAAQVVDLAVAYADALPDTLRKERNLLVIGQPRMLPLIGELKDALPAPFETGSNTAIERPAQVMYRTPQDANSGYIEIMASPWNTERAVLAVLAGTDDGLRQATATLIKADMSYTLNGGLAIVRGGEVLSGKGGAVATPVSVLAGGAQDPATAPSVAQHPTWILPAIGAAIVLMLAIIAFVVISSRRQRELHGSK